MTTPTTIAANTDGLGNRIKCIVSALIYDPNARVYWPRTDRMDCSFLDLFDNASLLAEELESEAKILTTWRLEGFPLEQVPHGFAVHGAYRRDHGRTIDFEYHRIPQQVIDHVLARFMILQPSALIAEQVLEIKGSLPARTVGVHIRSWVDAPERAYKFSLKNYFRIMDSLKDETFFVASDSEDILLKMESRYPRRIVTPAILGIKGNGPQRALTEMYILGSTNRLLASYGSTFSEVAWWLGGAQAEVDVVPLKKGTGDIDEISQLQVLLFRARKRVRGFFGAGRT